MKRTFSLLFSILFCSFSVAHAKPAAQAKHLAFTHVTVVDPVKGTLDRDATAIISGDRIILVGKTERVPVRKNAQVVDASGKFLIPGLWDMHFHALDDKQAREIFFPLLLANGITGVRNTFGSAKPLGERPFANLNNLATTS